MRDIFGTRLKEGDKLQLWYVMKDDTPTGFPCMEILPVGGCVDHPDGYPGEDWINETFGKTKNVFTRNTGYSYKEDVSAKVLRYQIGRVWAKPIHSPFQRTIPVNIVGSGAVAVDETFHLGSITDPTQTYKNIEVELSADCMM
tara:strand:- start:616 stop:1044 length:429 start_codon:yes stop_codon:yes gene_type:complete